MSKRILITGSTDGIGLLTAKTLAEQGHEVILHGRNPEKLDHAAKEIGNTPECHVADFSDLKDVAGLAEAVLARHDRLDVLINNAGIYKTPSPRLPDGMDVRFVVNTLAPYLLTRKLLPILPDDGRVVSLSSAAQAPVNVRALKGEIELEPFQAYAQSKLALTIWSHELAAEMPKGPVFVAVNPGSLLASKMVKEGFGVAGNDLEIGVDILCRASLDPEFANASGRYFDNDAGRFSHPHAAAQDRALVTDVMRTIEAIT